MSADLEAARDRLVAAALRTLVADEAGEAVVQANAGGQAHEREIAAEKDFDAAFAGLLAAARSWRDRAALAHLERVTAPAAARIEISGEVKTALREMGNATQARLDKWAANRRPGGES